MDTLAYPKRLIEVDLPIARISAHARREKSIRHGHISTLHIWWARRPLAACRAVICASLWPDPVDLTVWAKRGEAVPVGDGSVVIRPGRFLDTAQERMTAWAKGHLLRLRDGKISRESSLRLDAIEKGMNPLTDPLNLQRVLLDFIADFANWDNSTDKEYLETARALTQAAHEALGGEPDTRPLVVDPFAGGGSIPLEALRVGADAFASDLNPIPVLLNKVVLEYIPKYGQRLAEEVRKWGAWIKQEAEKELAEFYPKDPDGATPIAYLWARTIQCEGPGCGAEVPLMRSLWLAKKGKRSVALRMVPKPQEKRVDFEIIENAKASEERLGTVKRGSATCPCCGYTTPAQNIKRQLGDRLGGAKDSRLVAIVFLNRVEQGRLYRAPSSLDREAAIAAALELDCRIKEHVNEISLIPDEPYPDESGAGALSSSVLYGIKKWGDIFTPRQALALSTLVNQLHCINNKIASLYPFGFCEAITICLALAIDRQADYGSSICRWVAPGEFIGNTFGRQAIPMTWDFCEVYPFSNSTGGFAGAVSWISTAIEHEASSAMSIGQVEKASATKQPLPDDSVSAIFTDPPYYDAIAYGDLSDFFYTWLKRSLKENKFGLFSEKLVDKTDEAVHLSKRFRGPYAHKTREYFETKMQEQWPNRGVFFLLTEWEL